MIADSALKQPTMFGVLAVVILLGNWGNNYFLRDYLLNLQINRSMVYGSTDNMVTTRFRLILMISCGLLVRRIAASEINFANQGISDLNNLTFPSDATILILNDNPLGMIPDGIFQNLTELTSLALARTQLVDSSMTRESFLGLGSVTAVSIFLCSARSILETHNIG